MPYSDDLSITRFAVVVCAILITMGIIAAGAAMMTCSSWVSRVQNSEGRACRGQLTVQNDLVTCNCPQGKGE